MAITLVGTPGRTTSEVTAATIVVPQGGGTKVHTAGNLLAACFQHQFGSSTNITGVANTAGDTWTKSTSSPFVNVSSINRQECWYVLSTAGHATDVVTATMGGSNGFCTGVVYEFHTDTGIWSFVADKTGQSASGTAIASASFTLTGASVIVAIVQSSQAALPAPGTGYSTPVKEDSGSFVSDMYHIVSTSEAATATGTGSNEWNILAVAFVASGGGGGGRGLFMTPSLSGSGIGGSFFRDPLQAREQMTRRDRIYVPERYAA